MRKLLIALLLALSMASVCFADTAGDSKLIYSYTIRNDTAATAISLIPVTSIYPNTTDRVIGYSIMGDTDGLNSERWIEVYDSDNTQLPISAEVIGESEAAQGTTHAEWLPYSRYIQNGVVVRQGANTVAIVYFIRG